MSKQGKAETEYGNKLIAEFIECEQRPSELYGTLYVTNIKRIMYKDFVGEDKTAHSLARLDFHRSFDWQIPVYSKLAKAMKDLIVIEPGKLDDEIHDRFIRFVERYEHAIYNNDAEAGFEEIVFNLERYNEFKHKRKITTTP